MVDRVLEFKCRVQCRVPDISKCVWILAVNGIFTTDHNLGLKNVSLRDLERLSLGVTHLIIVAWTVCCEARNKNILQANLLETQRIKQKIKEFKQHNYVHR